MGGLGFALPAAIGVRMAGRTGRSWRWSGDGSSLYGIQALWSAAHYGCGVLFVVLANGRYAVMDRLAEQHGGGGKAPWPAFEEVSIPGLAMGLGCPATARRDPRRPAQGARRGRADPGRPREPLVLEVAVVPETTFAP